MTIRSVPVPGIPSPSMPQYVPNPGLLTGGSAAAASLERTGGARATSADAGWSPERITLIIKLTI